MYTWDNFLIEYNLNNEIEIADVNIGRKKTTYIKI